MSDLRRYAADLARDLGAPDRTDPVDSVLAYGDELIARLHGAVQCTKLSTLVDWVANKLGMTFVVVETDDELRRLRQEYAARGELGMARLAAELGAPHCYGGTFSLEQPTKGIKFVAVIDSRGEKWFRSYFTKCHEVAHILLLTDQQLLVFRRTHEEMNHPQEDLVDRVASRLGFYPPLLRPYFVAPLSFDLIHTIIGEMCPEASWESAVRGVVAAWPRPAVWLRAELGLKRAEADQKNQGRLGFLPAPAAKLRISDAPAVSASATTFGFFKNIRGICLPSEVMGAGCWITKHLLERIDC